MTPTAPPRHLPYHFDRARSVERSLKAKQGINSGVRVACDLQGARSLDLLQFRQVRFIHILRVILVTRMVRVVCGVAFWFWAGKLCDNGSQQRGKNDIPTTLLQAAGSLLNEKGDGRRSASGPEGPPEGLIIPYGDH